MLTSCTQIHRISLHCIPNHVSHVCNVENQNGIKCTLLSYFNWLSRCGHNLLMMVKACLRKWKCLVVVSGYSIFSSQAGTPSEFHVSDTYVLFCFASSQMLSTTWYFVYWIENLLLLYHQSGIPHLSLQNTSIRSICKRTFDSTHHTNACYRAIFQNNDVEGSGQYDK